MHQSLARDLYYFAYAIVKAGLMTWLLPAVIIGVCYEVFFWRRSGVLIPFPRKAWRRRAYRGIRRKAA